MKPRLSLRLAFLYILLSTILISGSAFLTFIYYQNYRELRKQDSRFQITSLVQSCPNKEPLKTVFLAELLNLTPNQPTNLYQFQAKEAEVRLKAFPLLTEVKIKKNFPGTLYVEYVLRSPIAFLGDYTNTAVDENGVAFPFTPFFTPKNLPKIYLSNSKTENFSWGINIQGDEFKLASELISLLSKDFYSVHTIDVSHAYSTNYGKRQIVLILKNSLSQTYFIRLNSDHFLQQIENFKTVDIHLQKHKNGFKTALIDLRLLNIAYIRPIKWEEK